jgi:hypothetical protein
MIPELLVGLHKGAEYWNQVPLRSTLRFLTAVFCLFASFGFILGNLWFDHPNATPNVSFAVVNGLLAACWAFTGPRRMRKAMVIVGFMQAAANWSLSTLFSKGKMMSALQFHNPKHYIEFNVIVAIDLIVAAYVLFLVFFTTESRRYYSTLTEMRLAADIHRSLVPEIRTAAPPFEFYGCSWPSGEVSGDLVDIILCEYDWLAYVADVSGHGVPAGVIMTMVKSAARTRLAAAGPADFAAALNEVLLFPRLKSPHSPIFIGSNGDAHFPYGS